MGGHDHFSDEHRAMQAAWDSAVWGVGFVAADGRWLRVNPALCELSGRSEAELLAGSLQDLLDFAPGERTRAGVTALLQYEAAGQARRRQQFVRASGEGGVGLVTISRSGADAEVEYLVQIEDVTELTRLSERLAGAAPPDSQTGLLSRRTFVREISQSIGRDRRGDEQAALLLLTIDDCAGFVETHGRDAGDNMLVAIADALSRRLRDTDVIARVADDRFGVLLPGTTNPALVARQLERLVERIEIPVAGRVESVRARVSACSIDDTTISGEVLLTELEASIAAPAVPRAQTGHPRTQTATTGGLRGLRTIRRRLGVSAIALAAAATVVYGLIGAVGVNDIRSDGILLPNQAWNGPADLTLAANAGVTLYRARMQLNCVDPNNTGTFDFSSPSASCSGLSYDQLVGALADRGMTLLPVLIDLDNSGVPVPPTATGSPSISEFAAFAAAAAKRYGPNGTFWPTCGCTPHPIQAWEIWNEENNGWWWGGTASASGYATVFAATRDALRSVDPNAAAVVGGLVFVADGQPSFIDPATMIKTLAASNANAFDAVAVHPYTDATGASAAQLASDALALINQTARDVVAATGPGPNGAPRQQIWVTEIGWSDQNEPATTIAAGLQGFFALLTGGARVADNIGPVIWYDLADNSSLTTRDDQLGLRYTTNDGADAGPKPAWSVFSAAALSEGTIPLPAALADSAPYVAGVTAGKSGSRVAKHKRVHVRHAGRHKRKLPRTGSTS
ncbi:MAG: diguanylate cyclase [Solirubrobacteraceae bacterium]|jgi:diguanylate cyclase (GGDEF)-like protein/PAS domain S-box-containing protein